MKLPKLILLLSFGFSLFALTGCGFTADATQTSENRTIVMPTSVNGDRTPTVIAALTTSTKIPLTAPTLESNEAYNSLQNLIEGSQDCRLPCWGGIIPGTSSSSEAKTILRPLFSVVDGGPIYGYKGHEFSSSGGGRNFFFDDDIELDFVLGWLLHPNEEVIQMLQIKGFAFQRQNEEKEYKYGAGPYKQTFGEYSLHGIFSRYGIPSKAWTFAYVYGQGNENPYPNPEQFQILLIYDKGILVEYTMPLIRIGNAEGEACPSEAFFDLWLIPKSTVEFYEEMWSSSTTGSLDFSYRLPIEVSTQMTFDQFYQAFRESNTPCLDIPLDIWPKH